MDQPPIHVLVVEDDRENAEAVRKLLSGVRVPSFVVECAGRLAPALERLAAGGIDVILLDLSLPESAGLSTIRRVQARAPGVPVVVLTGLADEALAFQAVHEGVQDYLVKGQVDGPVLVRSLRYAIERSRRDLAEELLTRQKELEALLRRQNEELEEKNRQVRTADRLKSEFLANMSHELRTPLNAIIGFAELMHDGRVGPVSAEHKEYLGDILASGRHLLQLINDVLDLAKVETGNIDLRPELVDVPKVVGEIRDILRTLAARKRIRIILQVDPGLGSVVTDPAKLKQVLYNYLSNALKFTPDGGRVTVRVGPLDAAMFRLEVEDTGIGIRPEDFGRLFREFQQLDAGQAKKYPGTGLGLALTKRIVEAQGGRVAVQSTPGQGSIFSAVLPCAGPANPAPGPATLAVPLAPRGGQPTVLVIEDDLADQAWLTETLTQAGYGVQVAASGSQALALSRQCAFDAITLDLLLPDTSSPDLLQALRARGPNEAIPIIVLTVVAEKGATAGFPIHDFLVKPVQAEELLSSLRRAGLSPDGGTQVLVVDDDPNALKLMDATLRHLGYQPVCMPDGASGLRAVEAMRPAAVVLDLMMPGMDGFEFLNHLRRTALGQRTPVLVWTVKELSAEDRTRLRAMAQGVVMKGERGTGLLLEELQRLLGRAAGSPSGRGAKDKE